MKGIGIVTFLILISHLVIAPVEYAVLESDLTMNNHGEMIHIGRKFTGQSVSFHDNATVASRTTYSRGQLDGVSYLYYENGNLKERRYYRKGEKHGVHQGFFKNGQRSFIYRFCNGVSVGNHKAWYESGLLSHEFNFVNGQPRGVQRVWRPDGKLRSNYVIREDGRRYGLVGIKRCKNIDANAEKITPITQITYAK